MSIERDRYLRHVPFCVTRPAIVDQYMWPEKDTTERVCVNGMSNPIYNSRGEISRFLPLEKYPLVGEIHPEVRMSDFPHFALRDRRTAAAVQAMQLDRAAGRLEGMYM